MTERSKRTDEGEHAGERQVETCAEAARNILARHHDRVTCGQKAPSDLIQPTEQGNPAPDTGERNSVQP